MTVITDVEVANVVVNSALLFSVARSIKVSELDPLKIQFVC
jgi:hypothetical protein